MRDILFRGKRVDNGEWSYGGFHIWEKRQISPLSDDKLQDSEISYMIIINSFADWNMPRQMQGVEVIFETVGQYTGLTDKNGNKIFEGDIVKWKDELHEIVYLPNYTRFAARKPHTVFEIIALELSEVVGNRHDNPELIEEWKDEP